MMVLVLTSRRWAPAWCAPRRRPVVNIPAECTLTRNAAAPQGLREDLRELRRRKVLQGYYSASEEEPGSEEEPDLTPIFAPGETVRCPVGECAEETGVRFLCEEVDCALRH